MIIKAKYPKIGNEYTGIQGFGSLYGGNQASNVVNIDSREDNGNIINSNQSDWA